MEKTKTIFFDVVFIIIGAIIAAMSVKLILNCNNILDGGVVGISIITNHLTEIKLGLLVFIINIPFMLIGLKQMGKEFLLKSIFSMAIFSVFLEIFEFLPIITDAELLAVAFGGLFLGIGVGLVIKAGGVLDGTEILAILINKKYNIGVGQFVLLCNVIIYGAAGFFFGIESTMLSLLTYFITSKVIDIIQEGMDQAKAVTIITNNSREMAREIHEQLGRTSTTIQGRGFISGEKEILYCVVTRFEINKLRKIVKENDISAFITISEVSEIIGTHYKNS